MNDLSKNKIISIVTFLVGMPLLCVLGRLIFPQKFLSWIVASIVILIVGIAFFAFERKKYSAVEISLIAVFTALSVAGRMIFAAIPGFKPCTAIIIFAGMYLGKEQGFMVGALTALISNFYFGQGLWTPFQMAVWGIIGFLAGIFSKVLSKNNVFALIFGAVSGCFFSFLMDLSSCLWADNGFNIARYFAMIVSSLQFTVMYMVSNVVFMLLLIRPTGRIFRRLSLKYKIGQEEDL